METLDIVLGSLMLGYVFGYVHKSLCLNRELPGEEESTEDMFAESVGECAVLGLTMMDDPECDGDEIRCVVTIEGQEVSIVVAKVDDTSE